MTLCSRSFLLVFGALLAGTQPFAAGDATPASEVVGSAHTPPAERLDSWLSTLPVDNRVAHELAWFKDRSGRALSPAYRAAAPSALRERLRAHVLTALARIDAEGCRPGLSVDYPGAGITTTELADGDLQRRFEDSFVIVELVECFRQAAPDPSATLDLYTAPAFRQEAQPKIARIWERDGLSCVRTRGIPLLLEASEACNRLTGLYQTDLAAQHSQVVAGGGQAGLQTVFFKESMKTFVRTPDGFALHYVNFTRSADLNGLTRRAARATIEASERRQVELLRAKLAGR